jgi:putative ABC transport system permease protein
VSLGVGTVAADPAVLGAALPGGFHPAALRSDTVYLPRTSFPPFPRGARVTLRGPAGAVHDLRVAYVAGLSVPSAVQPAMIERVTRHEPVRTLWVRVAPGADRARVVDEVDGAAVLGGELPVSGPLVDDVRVGDALAMARSASAGILAVAVLVGVVGAAATATLVVSERTREYAVLRALGLERRALGRLLLTRLVVVGSIASVVGVTTGTVLGLMVGRAVAHGLHLPTEFRLPLVPVVVIAVVTVLLVRAACLSPLDRASRIPPSRVLAKD